MQGEILMAVVALDTLRAKCRWKCIQEGKQWHIDIESKKCGGLAIFDFFFVIFYLQKPHATNITLKKYIVYSCPDIDIKSM